MYQNPNYLGYVQTASGKPTLFFDTGFLVQWDRHPELCGWYAYKNHHQMGANVSAAVIDGLIAANGAPGMVGRLMEHVRDTMAEEASEASWQRAALDAHPSSDGEADSKVDPHSRGHSDTESDSDGAQDTHANPLLDLADPTGHFVLFDSVDDEAYLPSPIYAFAGPLYRVGRLIPPAVSEKQALAAIGGFDGAGKPMHKRAVVIHNDLVRFT